MKATARALLWFGAAPLLCLAVFWRAPFIWFRIDDFAWLGLGNLPLSEALFHPFAQGTIRFFSERLYFLSLTELFGITAWPFRAVTLGVWFLDSALIQLIGSRLTGSRSAGLIASLLWTISPVLITPLIWASAFNEVLIAFVFLGAFYARLRGWRITEAILFLCGFGVLEIIVVYPALMLVHSLLFEHRRRDYLWMFAPAIAFALAHLFLIPKTSDPTYRLFFDAQLFSNLWHYLEWTAGPSHIYLHNPLRATQGLIASWAILAALAAFAAWKLRAGDRMPLFLAAWFVLTLAPVLPLANHVIEYYVTIPGIGLAWLAGWAIVSASKWPTRAAAATLTLGYAASAILVIGTVTAWHQRLTAEIRFAVRAVEATAAKYPGTGVAVTSFSEEAAQHCMPHRCFELVGASQSWLLVGHESEVVDEVLREVQAGRARVIDVTPPQAHDITRLWSTLNAAQSNTRRE